MRLRLRTAGESHGPALCGILDGLPHGLPLVKEDLDAELRRRQSGYGRGGRMKIERDEIEVLAGVRGGRTIGSPIAFVVRNLDHDAWTDTMSPWSDNPAAKPLTRPRPGHADLAGALRFEILSEGRYDVSTKRAKGNRGGRPERGKRPFERPPARRGRRK